MASNVQPKPFFLSFFYTHIDKSTGRKAARCRGKRKIHWLNHKDLTRRRGRDGRRKTHDRQRPPLHFIWQMIFFFFRFIWVSPVDFFAQFFFLLFFFFLMVSKCALTYFDPPSGWRWVPRTTTIKMIAHRMMDTHDRVSRATWWAALLVSLGQGSRFIPLHSISTAKHTHRATSSPFPEGRLNRCELRCAGLESSRVVVQT
jgi:hypothetical protein